MNDSKFVLINDINLLVDKDSRKIVTLREKKESEASLNMIVGEPEFLALAKEKKLLQTPRPLTHEMYLTILNELEIEFRRVEIYDLQDQAYLARVVYQGPVAKKPLRPVPATL